MAINLSNANKEEGIWVEYDEDVSFKIRHLSPKKTQDMRKGFLKRKTIGGMVHEEMTEKDQKSFDNALFDYMIEDWKGIVLDENVPAECTKENKIKLMNYSIDVSAFILEKARKIYEQKAVSQEQEIKN